MSAHAGDDEDSWDGFLKLKNPTYGQPRPAEIQKENTPVAAHAARSAPAAHVAAAPAHSEPAPAGAVAPAVPAVADRAAAPAAPAAAAAAGPAMVPVAAPAGAPHSAKCPFCGGGVSDSTAKCSCGAFVMADPKAKKGSKGKKGSKEKRPSK